MKKPVPNTMTAVVLTGHGGFDKLEYRDDVSVPVPGPIEVLVEVGAAGVNNTDINTRTAWYSKNVTTDTNAGGEAGFADADDGDASWSGTPLSFPRIQGADCCGRIVATGSQVDPQRMDIELASFPCAYTTAEGMLERASVRPETVLITGASGGVGSAAVQLAKRRKAKVIAIASRAKAEDVRVLGADRVIDRDSDLVEVLVRDSIDVVVDLVAGPQWPQLLDVLKRGGRYVTAGAIAGPIVELDVRTLYLKDLSFFGCTYQGKGLLENVIRYIENGEIRPVVSGSYPLKDIVAAQQDFIAKKHTGKLVLVPPQY